METTYHPPELKLEYEDVLKFIKGFPDYQKIPAENRYLLIREYEIFIKKEADRLGKQFRKIQALK